MIVEYMWLCLTSSRCVVWTRSYLWKLESIIGPLLIPCLGQLYPCHLVDEAWMQSSSPAMAVTSPQQGCFSIPIFLYGNLWYTPAESTSITCMYLGHRHTLLDVMVEIEIRSVHTTIQVCFIHGKLVINKWTDITVYMLSELSKLLDLLNFFK
jgi:hypothetical protein